MRKLDLTVPGLIIGTLLLAGAMAFSALLPWSTSKDCAEASVAKLEALAARAYNAMSARLDPLSEEYRATFQGVNSTRTPLYSDQSRGWLLPYVARRVDGSLLEGHAIVTCDDRVEFTG